MSQHMPLLFALACPLGMAVMMAAPALMRLAGRRRADGDR